MNTSSETQSWDFTTKSSTRRWRWRRRTWWRRKRRRDDQRGESNNGKAPSKKKRRNFRFKAPPPPPPVGRCRRFLLSNPASWPLYWSWVQRDKLCVCSRGGSQCQHSYRKAFDKSLLHFPSLLIHLSRSEKESEETAVGRRRLGFVGRRCR